MSNTNIPRPQVEVEFDFVHMRWYVTVDGVTLDDAEGRRLYWLDYTAAYAVKSGIEAASPAPAGSAFSWPGR